MKRIFFSLFVVMFMPPIILHAEDITLSLDEAIVIALRDNRDVLLKTEDVKKAKEGIAEVRAGLLPTLDFAAYRTLTRGLYLKDISQTNTQTTLKQYIYKGGKTKNTIGQNKYKVGVREALLDKSRQETALNVKTAFYTLLLAMELSDLNKNILDNTKAYLGIFQMRYAKGEASGSDILKIKESLGSVIEAYEGSLNQIQAASALLKNFLYLDENVNIIPRGEFIYEPKMAAYDEGFLQAMKARPEIRQFDAKEKADKKGIEIAKADTRPSIYASWDYYSRSTTSLTFSPNKKWNDYNVIGLTFSWPIFDGWATKAKVEQAVIDLKETRLLREKTIKDIALELKNAYLDLNNAIEEIKSIQAQVDLYKNTLSAVQDKYGAGIASILDLNNADLGYKVSLFNQKQAVYDYILAKARFDKATGGL